MLRYSIPQLTDEIKIKGILTLNESTRFSPYPVLNNSIFTRVSSTVYNIRVVSWKYRLLDGTSTMRRLAPPPLTASVE